MTEHLYYDDSFLYEFDAVVTDIMPASQAEPRPAAILDRTAFYPTSGGQVFDTGTLNPAPVAGQVDAPQVVEVAEREDGAILHFLDHATPLARGMKVRGVIDAERRRDHMQQHSGQHILSAAFVRLFNMATVSFHMGEDYCSIDLDTKTVTSPQVEAAERLANEVVLEDRPVQIRYVTQQEAQGLGLRKIPPVERGELRLIDIKDFDLTACGGTHVRGTGQVGCILLRKTEKVRQGTRVEFVCGMRAVKTARRDYTVLAEAAGLYSAHLWDVPQQVRKAQDEARAARRAREELLDEVAEHQAAAMLSAARVENGRKVLSRVFSDRDLAFIKLLAQKITRLEPAVALLASTSGQAAVVFAQSSGQPFHMGSLMKEALGVTGGRGGGSQDMAQGGPENTEQLESILQELSRKVR